MKELLKKNNVKPHSTENEGKATTSCGGEMEWYYKWNMWKNIISV